MTGTPGGGPGGGSDHFLKVSSGSFGGDVRLITHNDAQWLGNYTTAGVTEITAELMNLGSLAIPIRAVIRESDGGSSTPGYASAPFTLAPDGQWHLATFSLTTGMSGFNSPQSLATDLANVEDFRILSSVNPSGIGDAISASIGIDDITAVPEPSTLVLGALGMLGIGSFLTRRKSACVESRVWVSPGGQRLGGASILANSGRRVIIWASESEQVFNSLFPKLPPTVSDRPL